MIYQGLIFAIENQTNIDASTLLSNTLVLSENIKHIHSHQMYQGLGDDMDRHRHQLLLNINKSRPIYTTDLSPEYCHIFVLDVGYFDFDIDYLEFMNGNKEKSILSTSEGYKVVVLRVRRSEDDLCWFSTVCNYSLDGACGYPLGTYKSDERKQTAISRLLCFHIRCLVRRMNGLPIEQNHSHQCVLL